MKKYFAMMLLGLVISCSHAATKEVEWTEEMVTVKQSANELLPVSATLSLDASTHTNHDGHSHSEVKRSKPLIEGIEKRPVSSVIDQGNGTYALTTERPIVICENCGHEIGTAIKKANQQLAAKNPLWANNSIPELAVTNERPDTEDSSFQPDSDNSTSLIRTDDAIEDDRIKEGLGLTDNYSSKSHDNIWIKRNEDGSLTSRAKTIKVPMNSLPGSPFTASANAQPIKPQIVGGLTSVKAKTIEDYDPFSATVGWNWKDTNVTVGDAVRMIAEFAGYNLIVGDEIAASLYTLKLPATHQVVSDIDALTALQVLGGKAFTVVFDHSTRSVMHIVKSDYLSTDISGLPFCSTETDIAIQCGLAWIVGGVKCIYQNPLEKPL